MSNIKKILGERGAGSAPQLSEKTFAALWKKVQLVYAVTEETVFASNHQVAHKNELILTGNEVVYYMAPGKAIHEVIPP